MTLIGVDISSVARWRARLDRTPAVRRSAFSPSEVAWCGDEAASYALAWAWKEAAVKLIGTGFDGIGWRGVWSHPTPGGVEVGLGPQARDAVAAAGLAGPLRCAACSDGDLVVVALVAGRGDVAIRAMRFDCSRDRRARHRAARDAARCAADLAAASLAPPRPRGAPGWCNAADCAPAATWKDGTAAAASRSYGPGLVCVGVIKKQQERSSELEPSSCLSFAYDQPLRQQLLRHLTNSQRGDTCPRPLRSKQA